MLSTFNILQWYLYYTLNNNKIAFAWEYSVKTDEQSV